MSLVSACIIQKRSIFRMMPLQQQNQIGIFQGSLKELGDTIAICIHKLEK